MSEAQPGGGAADLERSIEQRVIEIVAEKTHTPVERIDRETRLFDITDSLGAVEVVMELEDEFEGSIPEDVADKLQTIGHIIDYVKEHLAPANTGP